MNKFDNLVKEDHDEFTNRFCYEILYDFIWEILVEAAQVCKIDKSKLEYSNLRRTWGELRSRLSSVTTHKESIIWDKLINDISSFRHKYAHFIISKVEPTIDELKKWRDDSTNFLSWFRRIIPKYIEKLPSFQAALTLYQSLDEYFFRVKDIIADYGEEDIPHLMEGVYLFDQFKYQDLQSIFKTLKSKIGEIDDITNLPLDVFQELVKFIEFVGLFSGREYSYLESSKCPKCGDKIGETQHYLGGGSEWDPEPSAVYYKVGCEKCDYTVHEETIDI